MLIVGCDFHPSWQQVAWLDNETGEMGEAKLVNGNGEAERWYRQLVAPALIGLEATGNSQWFVDLLQKLGHEVWIGDAAQIRASYIRKQKNDKRDAAHVLKLLLEGRFPRLWVPSSEQRDLRQLLIHRHKLVLPPNVKDVLGENHLAFFIHRVVERLDLQQLEAAYSDEGGALYAPAMLLKLWLYAYALGMTSARRLEQRTREDLGFRYLAGGASPDNWTLSAFRRRHGRGINDVFTQVLRVGPSDGHGAAGTCGH